MKQTFVHATHLGLLFAMILSSGCSTVHMQFSQSYRPNHSRRVAVLAVDRPSPSGLQWTILVAGEAGGPIGETVASRLEMELMGSYRVCERGQLQKILNEHKMQLSSLIDDGNIVEMGKLANLDGIITVTGYDDGVWVFPLIFGSSNAQAKLIDVESGEVLWTAVYDSSIISIIPILPFWQNTGSDAGNGIAKKLRTKESSIH